MTLLTVDNVSCNLIWGASGWGKLEWTLYRVSYYNTFVCSQGPADVKEPEKGMELFGIIIGLAAAVFILLLLLTGTVIGMRKRYNFPVSSISQCFFFFFDS